MSLLEAAGWPGETARPDGGFLRRVEALLSVPVGVPELPPLRSPSRGSPGQGIARRRAPSSAHFPDNRASRLAGFVKKASSTLSIAITMPVEIEACGPCV